MKDKHFSIAMGALGFAYMVYMASILLGAEVWSNLLSPLCALTGAVVIASYKNKLMVYWNAWLCLLLACVSWAVADTLWAWYDLILGLDPDIVGFFMVLYLLPNIFIAMAIGFYFIGRFRGWQVMQLTLNAAATLVVVFSTAWILFFHREFTLLIDLDFNSTCLLFYLLADLFCISCIFVIFASSSSRIMSWGQGFIVGGVVLFSILDSYYAYLILNEEYLPNTLIDGAYMASLLMFACAACFEGRRPTPIPQNQSANIGLNRNAFVRGRLLLLAPVIVVLFHGFVLTDVLYLLAVVAVHQILSILVQNAHKNEKLLQLEIDLNNQLEDRILARTMALTEANRNLEIITKQDEITGLYNRRYFMEELEKRIEEAASGDAVVVFYMDLDRFKAINDSYGHDMGDVLLQRIGERLRQWKDESMLLARMGGDEFILSFTGSQSRSEVRAMAEAIIGFFSEAIEVPPYKFLISVSVGVAQYPMDALDRSTLLKHADIAMYQAKESSSNHLVFYSSQVSDKIKRRHEVELLLKKANYNSEFELYYQPQFRMEDQALIGAEALIRWKNPEIGMVSPGEFIPIAEESDDIIAIGQWVMKNAISQMSRWNHHYGKTLQIGVNVSPKQLDTINFIEDVRALIQKYEIEPEWLDIEITESSTMNSATRMEEILTVLAGIGVSISIDDFGTGYSSLSYIKRFDIDRLKIARELISQIEDDYIDCQIVQAVVLMAKAMGLRTIAEGVETQAHLEKLLEIGCDECQGYHTGRPMPAGEFEARYLAPKKPDENEEEQ